jgi:methylated-DNA-[protein]-cysteine S-methyltransferase
MTATYSTTYTSPVGILQIRTTDRGISVVDFTENPDEQADSHPLLEECSRQLAEYFSGRRKVFELELDMQGTDFQKKVWSALLDVPFGKTSTYLHLALQLGNKKLIRAVGGANGRNPVAIIVPCHRIIGQDGTLIGYAGGLWRKKWLLEMESGSSMGSLF